MYRGYIYCDGKTAIEKYAGVNKLHTLEEVKNYCSYAGVLDGKTVMIDVDDKQEAEALFKVLSTVGVRFNCLKTTRGMHFYFKGHASCVSGVNLFVGVKADIKAGANAYDALKVDGQEREWIYRFNDDQLVALPAYLTIGGLHLYGMGEGDGRNDALFKLIHPLQRAGLSRSEIIDLFVAINTHLFSSPLSAKELAIITRDDAFISTEEVKKSKKSKSYYDIGLGIIDDKSLTIVNGLIFAGGVHVDSADLMRMIYQYHTDMTMRACEEVTRVIELFAPKKKLAPPHYVKFINGVWDVRNECWAEDGEEYGYINTIPHAYDAAAYNIVVDNTLSKIACGDKEIRQLIEEMIGYCLLGDCRLRKAFILYGDKRNGKSTLLKAIVNVLGENNVTTLDFKDLSKQFATHLLRGKLANIGDDIASDYVSDVSVIKKLVSGERLTADRKFKESIQFNNYAKLIFSANDLTRFKDDSGAMLDRLILIPCNAVFSETDADFNPMINRDMTTESAAQYIICLALNALRRLLEYNRFTDGGSARVIKAEYELQNNPLVDFFALHPEAPKEGDDTQELYNQYLTYCARSNVTPLSKINVNRAVCKLYKCGTKLKRIGKNVFRAFSYD